MRNIFTEHPHSVGETYTEHFSFAFMFGLTMIGAGLAALVHAIFPFLFQETGSNLLFKLTHKFIKRMPVMEDRVNIIAETINKKTEVK